jgi:hypothetical protein
MNIKRIVIIILIILVLVAIGVLVYYLFFKNAAVPVAPRSKTSFPSAAQNEIQSQNGRVARISDFVSIAPSLNEQGGKVRFFERATGNLFEAGFDGGNLEKISSSVFAPNLSKIVWSPQGSMFAALFDDDTQNFVYNFSNGKSSFFNIAVRTVSFSPNKTQMAYQDNNGIVISRSDASSPQTVLAAALPQLNLIWLKTGTISAWPAPSGLSQSFLISVNTSGAIKKIADDMYGLSALWSPDGKKLLFSHTTQAQGGGIILEIMDENGTNRKMLVAQTLADKCVWANDNVTVYCAVPQTIPQNIVMPDDYYKGILDQKDSFMKIDTKTSIMNTALENTDYDAQDLILSPQEDYLMFINQKDGFLYSLKL